MSISLHSEQNNTAVSVILNQEKLEHFRFHRPKTELKFGRERERKNVT